MTEITQAQIEIWKRDSEILDRVKKAVETDLNKPWYTEEFIKLIGGDKKHLTGLKKQWRLILIKI